MKYHNAVIFIKQQIPNCMSNSITCFNKIVVLVVIVDVVIITLVELLDTQYLFE